MNEIGVSRDGVVTTFAIQRPWAKNSLSIEAARMLKQAFRDFEADEDAKVGVVWGTNGTFCAGADLKELSTGVVYEAWAGGSEGLLGRPLQKPLIAAVEGHAVAGGLGLALYCDIRIADPTAVFGVFCRRFGVPMSDGTTVRLPRLIGESRALDLMLTGRGVDAAEAHRIGLVSEVVSAGSAVTRAETLARETAQFPELAMRSDRASLLASRGLSLSEALENESRLAEAAKRAEAQAGAARFAAGAGRHGGGIGG